MNLQRVRELHAEWEAGSAREDELAELRRLLPAVIDAAERAERASVEFKLKAAYYDTEYACAKGKLRKRTMQSLAAAYKWCARVLRDG